MASAESFVGKPEEPPDPNRYEPAILPALGGNSDIGFLFGVFGVLAKFEQGYDPYRWRGQALAIISVKNGPDGVELPTHHYSTSFNIPDLADGKLRLLPRVSFHREINGGYYGLGNASSEKIAPSEERPDAAPGRHNQYIMAMPSARLEARLALIEYIELLAGLGFEYAIPKLYAGSQLAIDAESWKEAEDSPSGGTSHHGNVNLAVGVSFDNRDHETVPTSGMYHNLSLRFSPGPAIGTDFLFLGVTLTGRVFHALLGDYLVVAARLLGDIIVGTAPFYELESLGVFTSVSFSGSRGVRGPPGGRYHGQVKIIGNFELRSMFLPFTLFSQRFRIGVAAFFDAGRVWASLRRQPDLDGNKIGMKFGTGGGPRIQWGETLIIRFDFAYSPDAADANPNMPLGIYMDMTHPF
ncbi:MAG: BamA/TamA family outer membrane protein [Proteobacteria bacterium]|nr:BamA/TamA family outer membrane protein [Pseudomonadota bacterium]